MNAVLAWNEALCRTPLQQRSQDSTSRMLDAAIAIVEVDGLSGLTIVAVAHEANVGVGTIYHRFRNRRGLILAAQEEYLSRLESQWCSATSEIRQLRNQQEVLDAVLAAARDLFGKHRNAFHVFLAYRDDDRELRERAQTSLRRIGEWVAEAFTSAFLCSREAAHAAYRMIFGEHATGTTFSFDGGTPRGLGSEDRIDHLGVALAALLASPAVRARTVGSVRLRDTRVQSSVLTSVVNAGSR